jgi:hypothetical protein
MSNDKFGGKLNLTWAEFKKFRKSYTEEEIKKSNEEDEDFRRRSKNLLERIRRIEIATEEKRKNGTLLTAEEHRNHGR